MQKPGKVVALFLFARRFPKKETCKHTRHRNKPAENQEEFTPPSLLRQSVKPAEDHKHGNERQRCKGGFHPPAVFRCSIIGNIGIKRGVVRSRTEERHHAVHHDDKRRSNACGPCRARPCGNALHADEPEGHRGNAP